MAAVSGSKRARSVSVSNSGIGSPSPKIPRLSPFLGMITEFEPGFAATTLWEYDPEKDFNELVAKSGESQLIELPGLAESMYGSLADENSFVKIPTGPTDITKKLNLRISKDVEADGFSDGEWKRFSIEANMPGGVTKLTVTGVLRYTNTDDETKYVYLYTYVSPNGTIYTDVLIHLDDYEFIGGEERQGLKEPSRGAIPEAQKGPITNPRNLNYPNRPHIDRGISVVTGGGRRKTYKTRKHKRTRRHKVTTPRKHGTRRGTRRR